jgi:GNAT superfamily N-acetyltransferase
MAVSRAWRGPAAGGPEIARAEDISALNAVFSESFTERYRRDGLSGVRVPNLHPDIWRYAIEDAGDGALLWRDDDGEIIAFNMIHCSGAEGWMGPLAVRPDRQGQGLGKIVVETGVRWLQERGAVTIGLETMPRTMDNIGFYSRLGFVPGRLTITLTIEAASASRAPHVLGRLNRGERSAALAACRDLARRVSPAADYTRELEITEKLGIGDTVLLWGEGRLTGFALCHVVPLVEGRPREEMRVLKMVLERRGDAEQMVRTLADYARRNGCQRAALRVQGAYPDVYTRLVSLGGRVRWTDLRMSLAGHPEPEPGKGIALSNWEI